jgi:ubiquinone/menaquinone biosynthesis C-methylase UbiE
VTGASGQSEEGAVQRPDRGPQGVVDAYFDSESRFWDDIYERGDVYAVIHQRRRAIALEWIARLRPAAGSTILEVGCGAGLTAVELARNGFVVDAIDSATEMIELTRRRAQEASVDERLRPALGDVHALEYDSSSFDVVLALGVIPWLHSPSTALHEIARVLRPGGHVILNADNAARLTDLLDPRYTPALKPLKQGLKRPLRRVRAQPERPGAPVQRHSLREFERLLSESGLEVVEGSTVGFGPFTLFGKRVLPARLEPRIDRWLQLRADRGVPGIRSVGAQYLVLARKSTP